MLSATVGQMLVNEALPEDMRDYNRVLDGKGVKSLLQQVAKQYPERYREVSFNLNQIGRRSAQDQGGMSFGVRHLRRSNVANEIRQRIQNELRGILADDSLTNQQRNEKIIRVVGRESAPQQKAVLEEALKAKNPLALQVLSGSRGKPMNLASLLASDMLYSDHRDEVIPIPVLRSYSEGLSPEEYWAGTYGARRGIIATKFATQEAGFLSKQLNQAGHRLVVMGEDADEEGPDAPVRGMIVDTDDMDNEGALLARDMGPYKKNTPLTPKILKHLSRLGKNRILVRSPLVGGSPEGGVYARDVGIRENGTLPGRGEQVGLQAAQALSEPISQGQLSAKHSGGVAGQEKAVGGFQYINQLIQTPQRMQGGAAHSTVDGTVQRIEPAPAGGHYVTINDEKHYVGEGFGLKVKKGDEVEAGDMLSDGIPNPAIITKYKGVGEGRRYFVDEFRKAMATSGMQGHRRNIELLARGLINHVQLTDEIGDHVPDDIIPYSTLEHTYKPREGHERLTPKKAVGQYLERPVLHYTIGTKIRPSMLKNFEEFGVNEIPVHRDPPPFQSHMVRGMYQLQHDPDWMTQMYGSGLKKSLLESTARGATSEERGTSFIPSLATGTDFGEVADRAVIQPKPGYAAPKFVLPDPEEPVAPPSSGSMFFGNKFKVAAVKRADSSTPVTSQPPITSQPPASSVTPTASTAAAAKPKNLNSSTFNATAQSSIAAPSTPYPTQQQSAPTSYANAASATMQYPQQNTQNAVTSNLQNFSHNYKTMTSGNGGPTRRLFTSQTDMPSTSDGQFGGLSPNIMPQQPSQPPAQYNQIQPLSMEGANAETSASSAPTGNSPPNAAAQTSAPAAPESEKGQGNSLDPFSGNAGFRGLGSLGLSLATSLTNPGTAAPAAGGWGRTALNIGKNMLMPGSEIATGVATSTPALGGFVPGLAVPALTALGGMTVFNAGTEALDAVGLLPEWAGGDGIGNFGWDQRKFNRNTTDMDYGSAAVHSFMNPLKSVTSLGQAAGEGMSALGNKAYDIATWSTERSRAAANDKVTAQSMEAERQKQLANRQKQLEQTEAAGGLSPNMRQQNANEMTEVQNQIADSKAEAAALEDETAKWQLGNRNWIGGNYQFRDNAAKSLEGINQKITQLEQQGIQTPEQKNQLEYLKRKQFDYGNLINLHNKEVGYSGTGGFGDFMRNTVKTKKQKIITLGQEIRQATTQRNMAKVRELQQEQQHLAESLQDYRSWAGQPQT